MHANDNVRILSSVARSSRRRSVRGLPALVVTLGLSLGTGCAGGPGGERPGRSASGGGEALADGATTAPVVAGVRVDVAEVQFSAPPVDRYGSPVAHALTPAEQALIDGLVGGDLRHEPGLSRAARELARTAPEGSNIPSGLIDGVMAWVGLVDPAPRLGVVELPAGGAPCGAEVSESCREAVRSLVAATKNGLLGDGGPRWLGAGTAVQGDGSVRLVVAVLERAVVLDPIASQVAAGGRVRLHGRLVGKRSKPSVEVVDADGRWTTVPARVSKNEFTAEVACGRGRGAYQVEVLAEGAYGPEVVANFPVYCGTTAPRSLRVEIERVDARVDAADVARSNFAALNATRERQGLRPLLWDNAAAGVAAGHSADMATHNFVGHNSPRTGDVEARFKRAGVAMAVLRENVARGYGPRGIHESLMASPGHRANMLAPDVTHVGIGAVIGPPETDAASAPRPIFLTQNFYAKIGEDLPADPVAALRARVDELRRASGAPPVQWDEALFGPSQGLAEGIAAGKKQAAERAYDAKLAALPYQTVQHHEVLAPSFAALDGLALWKQRIPGAVGLGLAQVKDGKNAGSLAVVVTVGTR